MAEQFNIIAEQDNCTVVAKYEPQQRSGNAYQSEAELEQWLITQLQHQGYEYPTIRNEEELLLNLRKDGGVFVALMQVAPFLVGEHDVIHLAQLLT